MPTMIRCITDGCLAERNAGERCKPESCVGCRWYKPAQPDAEARRARLAELTAELDRMPGSVRAAVLGVAESQVLGRRSSNAELAVELGVDETDVHRARFEIRRLEGMVGR